VTPAAVDDQTFELGDFELANGSVLAQVQLSYRTLGSQRSALTTDPAWNGERFVASPKSGLHSFALIYASWAASQAFYRLGIHRRLGYATVDDYVERGWLPAQRRPDPHDLLAMLDVWLVCDVAQAAGLSCGDDQADLVGAMGRVRARSTVVACGQNCISRPRIAPLRRP
jgi:homoserine acetyltransferase